MLWHQFTNFFITPQGWYTTNMKRVFILVKELTLNVFLNTNLKNKIKDTFFQNIFTLLYAFYVGSE